MKPTQPHPVIPVNQLRPGMYVIAILNAKGDSLRRRWEGNFAGASAPLVLNVLLDHLQRCSAARARKVRA